MSLSESITSIRTMLDNAEKEVKCLESGKKASSARARKSLQNIKSNCHSLRKSVTTHTKNMETKPRAKKTNTVAPSSTAVESGNIEPEPIENPFTEPVKPKRQKAPRKPKPKKE